PGMKAAEAANKLGWHWWPGTNAIPSQKNKTLEQCGRWGCLRMGLPAGAKASFDLIYMPQAPQAGAQVITGAGVGKVVTDDEGPVLSIPHRCSDRGHRCSAPRLD